jgi:arginase family enzyme
MTPHVPHSIHIDLDGAFSRDVLPAVETPYLDCREWGPRLRYSAKQQGIDAFYEYVRSRAAKFTLYGSGDFHHLSALWLRRIEKPFVLVSFDNHPDWDNRPPRWCCGTWINRALDLPMLQRAAIWGCGNFELNWPGYLFVSRTALRTKRFEAWPWRERLAESGVKRWGGMTREGWRNDFQEFTRGLAGQDVYITVDLDCLAEGDSVTNWEHGLFTVEDIAWAIGEIRQQTAVIGGDVCGAYSEPRYERPLQRFIANRDHPKGPAANLAEARKVNGRTLERIWGTLTRDQKSEVGGQKP